jgi:hypothetical protein
MAPCPPPKLPDQKNFHGKAAIWVLSCPGSGRAGSGMIATLAQRQQHPVKPKAAEPAYTPDPAALHLPRRVNGLNSGNRIGRGKGIF